MKVLMFNGSPKAKGCTYTASKMAKVLNEEGIETERDYTGYTHREVVWAVAVVQKQVNVCMVEK